MKNVISPPPHATADVIVVGGGHAGIEAAHAAARLGAQTILLTGDPARIGTLACNPSIGGSAKGQIVREIDALGGVMARLIDRCSLHSRFLHEAKGPAVRALRAQADKPRYVQLACEMLATTPGLQIERGLVEDLLVSGGRIDGVVCADGKRWYARCIVLATGTFLGGRIYRGEHHEAAGRIGEQPALALSAALARVGFPLRRLKTGTPPRIARDSIDRSAMQIQEPSQRPLPFSYQSPAQFAGPQLPCYITTTNAETHRLVRENLARSPLYGLDLIRGIGPRYCPSIEDKVVKFSHHESHQIFIEPEGWDEPTLYVGGFSTSLPAEIQERMLRTLPGLEEVRMIRAGYAVEYDMVPPTELHPTLATRRIKGLFHCGQLNGTSGYEEAAAQGLIAGINAARIAHGKEPILLSRAESYIGTMLDDLTSKGVEEPYRMLTSRAEHRILFRHDNADLRLTPLGIAIGLVDEETATAFDRRRVALEEAIALTQRRRCIRRTIAGVEIAAGSTIAQALRRPEITYADIASEVPEIDTTIGERVAIELRCEGYARRERLALERRQRDEERIFPGDFQPTELVGLSREARERLAESAPRSLGAASRLRGVTPADLAIISVHLHRHLQSRRGDHVRNDQHAH